MSSQSRFMSGNFSFGWSAWSGPGASALPGVVDVDVRPAVLDQAALGHRRGLSGDLLLIDLAAKAVPRVPAKRRRQTDLIADFDHERMLIAAERIDRRKRDAVFAGSSN